VVTVPTAGVVAAATVYAGLVVRRRRVGRVPWTSVAAFAAGLAVCLLALESPLDEIGEQRLISAHMTQHELLAVVAPLLFAIGLDYRVTAPVLGPVLRPLVRHPASRRMVRTVTDPRLALVLWTGTVVGWQLPDAYAAALASDDVHITQHVSLLLAGVVLWLPVLRPLPTPHHLPPRAKLVYLGLAGLAGSATAAALIWAPGLLYGDYADAPLLWLPSRLADQRLAGALMMAVDMAAILGTAVWVAVRWVAGRDTRTVRLDKGGTGGRTAANAASAEPQFHGD
jgi:cytochrome c oxidase assembly factor CtaG